MSTEDFIATMIGLLMGMAVAIGIVIVFSVIVSWKIYRKMGVPGWYSIIPFFNNFVLYERVWEVKYFWMQLFFSAGGMVLSTIAAAIDSNGGKLIVALPSLILSVTSLIIYFKVLYYLCKSFGKSGWFYLGLIFITFIFVCILAFGRNTRYCGNYAIYKKNMQFNGPYGGPYNGPFGSPYGGSNMGNPYNGNNYGGQYNLGYGQQNNQGNRWG